MIDINFQIHDNKTVPHILKQCTICRLPAENLYVVTCMFLIVHTFDWFSILNSNLVSLTVLTVTFTVTVTSDIPII